MTQPVLMPFQDLPFNGDTFICKEFLNLRDTFQLNVAVETGSCFFVTTEWLANNFENVFTVEINNDFASYGVNRVADKKNVNYLVGWHSVAFLTQSLKLNPDDRVIYFLDAHWENDCPLLDEIQAISLLKDKYGLKHAPIIAIHDFYTGDDSLGYDSYNGNRFDYDFIKGVILELQIAYGCMYSHKYNTEAEGAKRGIIYLFPDINL